MKKLLFLSLLLFAFTTPVFADVYTISVTTASVPHNSQVDKGTQVWAQFYSAAGSTSPCQLNVVGVDDFELGATNVFACNLVDIGPVTQVVLWLKKSPNTSGQLDDWQFTNVTVTTKHGTNSHRATYWLGDSGMGHYSSLNLGLM